MVRVVEDGLIVWHGVSCAQQCWCCLSALRAEGCRCAGRGTAAVGSDNPLLARGRFGGRPRPHKGPHGPHQFMAAGAKIADSRCGWPSPEGLSSLRRTRVYARSETISRVLRESAIGALLFPAGANRFGYPSAPSEGKNSSFAGRSNIRYSALG